VFAFIGRLRSARVYAPSAAAVVGIGKTRSGTRTSGGASRIDVRVKWPTGDTEDARQILGVVVKRVSASR
jgi:hypothetical protein